VSKDSTVFISYARSDKEFANKLASELGRLNGIRVLAERDSIELAEQYIDEISAARAIIVLLSKHLKNSEFVHQEVATVLKSAKARAIIPVLLDEEARDNLVWPLLADRVAFGPDVDSIRRAVVDATEESDTARPHRSRRRWMLIVLMLALVPVIMVLGVHLAERPRNRDFEISIIAEERGFARRGSGFSVGDILIIRATVSDLLVVYHDERLILKCPGAGVCTQIDHGWEVRFRLEVPGTYEAIHASGVGPVNLTGELKIDVDNLNREAQNFGISPAVDIR